MKVFYTDQFNLPLPEGHSFPIEKYILLRKRITESGIIKPENLCISQAATDEDILRIHDTDYLDRVKKGELTPKEERRIGLPWSKEMVERILTVGTGSDALA